MSQHWYSMVVDECDGTKQCGCAFVFDEWSELAENSSGIRMSGASPQVRTRSCAHCSTRLIRQSRCYEGRTVSHIDSYR